MIAFRRTACLAPGKTASAIAFARDVASYMKEAYGLELEVQLPIGGNPNRIAWSAHYKDLAAFEALNVKLLADKHYWEVVNRGSENFLPGTVDDSIWRSV